MKNNVVNRPPPYGMSATLAILLGPAFLYPCLYLIMLIADTAFGDAMIFDHLLHVSKRDIWELFWGDWAAALIPSYILALPVVAAALLLHRRSGNCLWLILPGLALFSGLAVSLVLFSGDYMVVLLAAALLFSLLATMVLLKCTPWK